MDDYSDDSDDSGDYGPTNKRDRLSDSDSEEYRPRKKLCMIQSSSEEDDPPEYFERDTSLLRRSITKHILKGFTKDQQQAFAYNINNGVKESLELFNELVDDQFESLITAQPTKNLWKLGLGPTEIKKYGKTIKTLRKENNSSKITIQKILDTGLNRQAQANLLKLYDTLQSLDEQSLEYITLTQEINKAIGKAIALKLQPDTLESENTLKELIGQEKPLKTRIIDADIDNNRKAAIYEKYLLLQKTPDDSVTAASLEEWIEEALKTPYTKTIPSVIDNNPGQSLIKLKHGFEEYLSDMDDVLEPLLTIFNNRLHNPDSTSLVIGLLGSPGVGKCLGYNTPILMHNGSVKMVQDVVVSDKIMGDDSSIRNVLSIARGQEKMYTIKQEHTDDYRVNESHILSLMLISDPKIIDYPEEHCILMEWFDKAGKHRKFYAYNDYNKFVIDKLVKELVYDLPSKGTIIDIPIKEYVWRTEEWKEQFRGYKVGIEYPERDVDIDPYELGKMLYDADYNKIPDSYMINSKKIREKVFEGIITNKTFLNNDSYSIQLCNEELALSILNLSRSLGYRAKIHYHPGSPQRPWKNRSNAYYQVYVERDTLYRKDFLTYQIQVCEEKVDYYYGFEIDGNHRFVLGDYTVTHNTAVGQVMAKVWGLPFKQISLGGIVDSSILDGQHSGWVGSSPGRFAKALQEMGAINGIIFLDEIDKLGSSTNGLQVQYSLLHSTDPVQNKHFIDHYLGSKLPLDLSKCLIICALNKTDGLDPALLNRMQIIKVPDYTPEKKKNIMRKHLFPHALNNTGLNPNAIIVTEGALDEIIKKVEDHEGKQGGVRGVKAAIHLIIDKLNLLFRTSKKEKKQLKLSFNINITNPLTLTEELVGKLYNPTNKENTSWSLMYS